MQTFSELDAKARAKRNGFSDDDLMEAWAETGDPDYLTPSTMQKMDSARFSFFVV